MDVETVQFMGEIIDVCTACDYAVDSCKCDTDNN